MSRAATAAPVAGNNMTLPGRSRKITVEPVEAPQPVKVPQTEPSEPLPEPDRPAIEPAEPIEPVQPVEPTPEREPEKIPA